MRNWRATTLSGLLVGLSACAQPPASPPMPAGDGGSAAAGYQVLQIIPRPQGSFLERFYGIRLYNLDPTLEYRLKEWRGRSRPWLTRDAKLDAAARVHSRLMAVHQTGFLVSPDGKTLEDRMRDHGVTYGWWAGYAWGAQEIDDYYTVNVLILRNMDRSYVTNDRVRRYGIGVYRRGNKAYSTLLFTD